jgi:hypothetical protein
MDGHGAVKVRKALCWNVTEGHADRRPEPDSLNQWSE